MSVFCIPCLCFYRYLYVVYSNPVMSVCFVLHVYVIYRYLYVVCVCVYSTPFMSVYYSQVHVMYSLRVCIERPFLGSSDELVE